MAAVIDARVARLLAERTAPFCAGRTSTQAPRAAQFAPPITVRHRGRRHGSWSIRPSVPASEPHHSCYRRCCCNMPADQSDAGHDEPVRRKLLAATGAGRSQRMAKFRFDLAQMRGTDFSRISMTCVAFRCASLYTALKTYPSVTFLA